MNSEQRTYWPINTNLGVLRQRIHRYATRVGLTGMRREDLLLAVHEAAINVLEHGGGSGTVTLWHNKRNLTVNIVDIAGRLTPHDVHRRLPFPRVQRGFGLWLIGQLCDEFTIHQERGRSHVRLRMRLHPIPAL
ncbi:ATP-binding protein [Streptosporangium sp. 'caverna']|uniref:ATP-binding protein n=1 Tax=Streptosporangium sp. 'caverna' TaxID=2202249 RepID=UPI000D7D7D83|nr:ATP-binding protein [Streptosporangium sp. 'caverna']AWS43044.1 hypothetical protein DKM19_18375 [Streptosporangium sp. 'caverna']